MNDSQLIQEYAASRSDEVFKAIVDQYVGLVFSTCFRQLKDRHLAEDATQAVFIVLSQKAGALRQSHLTGWLLTTSRYACANIRISQQRRQRREQVVAMKQNATTETPGNELLDLLDEALCHLKTADREALVLRYLKEQPLSDVAEKLGVSQEAARKRVERGIEKLRNYFSGRGIITTSASLSAILTEQIPGAALPLAARHAMTQSILQVCHAGAHSAAASVAIAKGTQTMMILAKLKTVAAVVMIVVIVAALGTTSWMISRARADNSPATPASASPASPPIASAATPSAMLTNTPTTTPSAIDLTTPDNTARSFFTAIKNGDRASAYACLTADPNRPTNLMDAMLAWNLAQNHLVHAVIQSFGGDGAAVKRFVTVDMIAYTIGSSPDGTSQAIIEGDNAALTANIPPWMISMAPANFQPILHNWADKKLYFHKQSDGWKFDIDRSMRVIATLSDKNNRRLNRAVTIAYMMDNARSIDQIAFAVDLHQITTTAAAAAAVDTAGQQIRQKYNVSNSRMDVVPGNSPN